MCGIVGISDLRGFGRPDPGLVATMADTMTHRGPDGSCVVEIGAKDSPGLTFGFRRLSILDLGAGARAYADEAGRFRVICNGEVYNDPELRRALLARGHRFETRCDTEVIPHLYEEHGLSFVSHLNGMFAFAIFDTRDNRLVLGRDRAGEKPLYYLEQDGELMFASEIKALLAHPRVSRRPDVAALTRYLLYGYFPAPHTPFEGVRKLPAGHLLIAERGRIRIEPYWDLRRFVRPDGAATGAARGGAGPTEAEAAGEVRRLLAEAVRLRMRADVPVGVFFSGGVDSSSIAALAVEATGKSVPTFTVGFRDPDFNEAEYARRAAAHLGTEHHETVVGEPEMLQALLEVARVLDEPLADASVVPTYILSRFARLHVKVALGGEGGDELFAGYPTYLGDRLARLYGRLPGMVRGLARRLVDRIPPAFNNVGTEYLLKKFVAAADLPSAVRHQIWFGAFSPERQRDLLSDQALAALPAPNDPLREARAITEGLDLRHPLDALLLTDFLMYLQDDLLTKVDRASMAASLEVRAPFLHHALVEYVVGLPAEMKLKGLTSKRILKMAMGGSLTPEIVSRRKRGFNIPLARFMHSGLAPLLRRALDPQRVARAGLLRPSVVSALLGEHMERRRDNGRLLWNLMMLQIWHSRHFEGGDLVA
ncbi:MAG TPA: asparagine synthase (glutamine-hydrolyzing) [Candidatus Polarisedimenticolia bacterium]|nr:asparagine synthase (glutamine-hydrolyzing) [Candidatus Polarisedimenticolia bacterium]